MLVCHPLTSRPGSPGGVPLAAVLTVIAAVIVAAVLLCVEAVLAAGALALGDAGLAGVATAAGSNSGRVDPIEWLRAWFIVARLGSAFGPAGAEGALVLGAGDAAGSGAGVAVVPATGGVS